MRLRIRLIVKLDRKVFTLIALWRRENNRLQIVRRYRTCYKQMIIRSVRHRGLKRLIEDNHSKGLRPDLVNRVRNILTALVVAEDMKMFRASAPPGWRVHRLSGDRKGTWSISTSGNWRITFEEEDGYVDVLDLEDYH